ncbi:MAG: nicotinate-nucleotide adenylyltransferase [Synergistes sp.]|nr:nicotinate-nucleotide adenylyltransferase [Synergistes sp.]
MSYSKRRIGIMGGTFDPIHNGHLLAAEEARAAFELSEVIFIPTGRPPHKSGKKITCAEDRCLMAELATVDCPYFKVSRIEINREGSSYTIDTLREVTADPEYTGVQFYFITGLDAILGIMTWKNAHEVTKLCKLVAVSRYGYTHERMNELPDDIRDKIIPLEIPLLAISSTELRDRIKRGRSIKFMVPSSIEQFIIKKQLYKD